MNGGRPTYHREGAIQNRLGTERTSSDSRLGKFNAITTRCYLRFQDLASPAPKFQGMVLDMEVRESAKNNG